MKDILKKIYQKAMEMSDEDFRLALDKYKDDEFTKFLKASGEALAETVKFEKRINFRIVKTSKTESKKQVFSDYIVLSQTLFEAEEEFKLPLAA